MTIEEMEVLIIHKCNAKNYQGVKITDRRLLPTKCSNNLCIHYGIWYGTCVKTGEKCTDCTVKAKGAFKAKPSSIVKGESITFVNAKRQTVERIVLSEDKTTVTVLELIMGQEKTVTINRGVYIQRRAEIRKADRCKSLNL